MIIAHTKWGEQLYETAFGLLSKRVADGFYYDNWDDGDPRNQWEDRAKAILSMPAERCAGPGRAKREEAAWAFLRERDEFEYEGVQEATVGP